MNELEKREICEYRIKGLGYKAISRMIGLSRDTVRDYCKRNEPGGIIIKIEGIRMNLQFINTPAQTVVRNLVLMEINSESTAVITVI